MGISNKSKSIFFIQSSINLNIPSVPKNTASRINTPIASGTTVDNNPIQIPRIINIIPFVKLLIFNSLILLAT